CHESACRGNEHRILRTRFAWMSAASPVSPLPALLLTMVRSLAPCAISASMSAAGIPALPKPWIITVAPSGTSASAASGLATILSIIGAVDYGTALHPLYLDTRLSLVTIRD